MTQIFAIDPKLTQNRKIVIPKIALKVRKKPRIVLILGFFTGTPKGTRTPDLLIRSQSLYPTELSAHAHHSSA